MLASSLSTSSILNTKPQTLHVPGKYSVTDYILGPGCWVAPRFNPSSEEVETDESELRPPWSTQGIPSSSDRL